MPRPKPMTQQERAVMIGHDRLSVRELRELLRAYFPKMGDSRATSIIAQFFAMQ